MANVIDSLNLNDIKYSFTLPYGSCDTSAGTRIKIVTVSNFNLDTGSRIAVKFTTTNTAANPALNVNDTGAKAIYYRGAVIPADSLTANRTYEFVYNGTQWELIGDIDTNTTYGAATSSTAGLMSAADKQKLNGMWPYAGYEAYLHWGGTSIAGDISPLDASLSNLHSANRFAFANPEGIIIEYSRDGGSSWIEYPTDDLEKQILVSGPDPSRSFSIGGHTSDITVNDKLRITLNATLMGVYTKLRKFLINISTDGAGGSTVLIEKAIKGSENTFSTINSYPIAGWSGWNSIPIQGSFGGDGSNHMAVLRLTFSINNLSSSYSNALHIHNIFGFGVTQWLCPSEMAKSGHLYSYNAQQQATFPAQVTAPTFVGDLNGNATSADSATNDSAGQKITTTYIKQLESTQSMDGHLVYTKGDGTTGEITIPPATPDSNGLMTAKDKENLDSLEAEKKTNAQVETLHLADDQVTKKEGTTLVAQLTDAQVRQVERANILNVDRYFYGAIVAGDGAGIDSKRFDVLDPEFASDKIIVYYRKTDKTLEWSYNDILDARLYDTTGTDAKGLMSQAAITNELSKRFSVSGGIISGNTVINGSGTTPFIVQHNSSNLFKIRDGGLVYAKQYYTTGADYAEYMEWADENSLDEDRRGLFVVIEDKNLIRVANETDDIEDIVGIVSSKPSVAANDAELDWHKKYLTDIFGNVIMDVVTQPEYIDENGELVPAQETQVPRLNPEFDPDREYIPRGQRKEWAAIGMLGQIIMVDDGTCKVGKRCRNGKNGVATLSTNKEGWRVLERLDDNHIRVLFK